jgi:hypothetical protein
MTAAGFHPPVYIAVSLIGFLNRSALAYSVSKIGIFTPVRQETLSMIAEVGQGLMRCPKEHTTSRKRKSKENSFSGKRGKKIQKCRLVDRRHWYAFVPLETA